MTLRLKATALGLVLAGVTAARAELDPTLLQTIVIGESPNGGQQRLNARRTGRSQIALPDAPRLLWRGKVPGGALLSPVTDGRGHLIVASRGGHLVQLDRRGRLEWSVQLSALAAAAPLVRNDGTRLLLTQSGQLHGLSPAGRQLFSKQLGLPPSKGPAQLLALRDGTLAVAQSNELLRLERDGEVRVRLQVPARIRDLIAADHWLLCVTTSGQVFRCDGYSRPSVVAELRGLVGTPAFVAKESLLWSDGRRVTLTRLKSRRSQDWLQLDQAELVGPTTVVGTDQVAMGVKPDGVIVTNSDGELRRLGLGNEGGAAGPAVAPISDPQGRLAFVGHNGQLLLVDRHGAINTLQEARCIEPLGITPVGPGQLVLACASGRILAVGDASRFTNGDGLP